jgi:hypothetical protein
MNPRINLILVCLFLMNGILLAQERMTGEAIVQLKSDSDIATFVSEMNAQLGLTAEVKESHCIYQRMNLWLVAFNENAISMRDFIYEAQSNPSVSEAQVNHIIEERLIPDDPFFSQQWHHQQANDHDIDSDLAWDVTTGGTSALGDEIVVCVVELGGAQWNTPDIIDNHWINTQEIPGNGNDDDNNGYVDDYDGWNTASSTDVITAGSHGTRVCSMIGSKGNNNTGVVGVNWDVKMMLVEISSANEASAIAAYAYPLEMRRLYNTTQGQQGAFVVATNSSWGTDNGQPADAPLWCAMYDSLGAQGVLSCASTTNNNTNVDLFGDLPTACPSDFLISVGRTNSDDVRTSGGYGITAIDLAAPGDNVYLANNTTYATTTGTSFSSPCVAGGIALLYSSPCTSFIETAHDNPQASATAMKNYILDGVDTTSQLLGEMVSGGRFNVNNSLQLLLEACDVGECMAPFALDVTQEIGTLNYTLSWSDIIATDDYRVEFRVMGNTNWSTIEINGGSATLTNLDPCSDYEARVAAHCADTLSAWSTMLTWTTDGCCVNPNLVQIANATDSTLAITWDDILATDVYDIIITDEIGNPTYYTTSGSYFTFQDLQTCSNYSIVVAPACNVPQGPIASLDVFTPGCENCALIPYCSTSANDDVEFIAYVHVADIEHTSENSGGYLLVPDITDTLHAGNTYSITCTPGYMGNAYNENFRIWIDFNIDGDFEDDGELVFDPSATTIAVNGIFTMPTSVTEGISRMRVSMTYTPTTSNNEPLPCGNLTYGEIEDYCVTLSNEVHVDTHETSLYSFSPNPASHHIQFKTHCEKPQQIFIYTTDGRLAMDASLTAWPSLDVTALSSGLYYISVQNHQQQRFTLPLVIHE